MAVHCRFRLTIPYAVAARHRLFTCPTAFGLVCFRRAFHRINHRVLCAGTIGGDAIWAAFASCR